MDQQSKQSVRSVVSAIHKRSAFELIAAENIDAHNLVLIDFLIILSCKEAKKQAVVLTKKYNAAHKPNQSVFSVSKLANVVCSIIVPIVLLLFLNGLLLCVLRKRSTHLQVESDEAAVAK